MMQKIILPMFVVGLAAGATLSATGAYFTDSEASLANVFTSGALTIDVADTKLFDVTGMMPGDDGSSDIEFSVEGNDAYVQMSVDGLAGDTDLLEVLDIDLSLEKYNGTTTAWEAYAGDITETITNAAWTADEALPVGNYRVTADYGMDADADNDYQDLEVEANIVFDAHQAANVADNPYIPLP